MDAMGIHTDDLVFFNVMSKSWMLITKLKMSAGSYYTDELRFPKIAVNLIADGVSCVGSFPGQADDSMLAIPSYMCVDPFCIKCAWSRWLIDEVISMRKG